MVNKILIVDDDESILNSLSFVLEDKGYSVETLIKGEDIYKTIEKNKPSLIFLDVLMSGIDGREICKKLKSDATTKDIAIIMISAHPTAMQEPKEVCADEYLAKPFDLREMLSKVKKYIN